MFVGGTGSSAAIWLNPLGKTAEPSAAEKLFGATTGKDDPAKPAATNTRFPTSSPAQLNADALLALQEAEGKAGSGDGDDGGTEVKSSAAEQFLDYMKKTPEERLREKILKALGVSEEDIKNMSLEERMGLKKKIQDYIKETMVKAEGEGEPGARGAVTANAVIPAAANVAPKNAGVTASAEFLLQLI